MEIHLVVANVFQFLSAELSMKQKHLEAEFTILAKFTDGRTFFLIENYFQLGHIFSYKLLAYFQVFFSVSTIYQLLTVSRVT